MPDAVRVLFEDDALVALDKPAGLCVIPAREGDPENCLRHRAESVLGRKLWVVHRIDRETSGVVLMARTAEAHRTLNDAFAGRAVAKTYLALVRPAPAADSGVVDVALHAARKGRMRPVRPGEAGLDARTEWRVVERLRDAAVLEAEPRSGRQHQIRVHLHHAGSPILGDRLYASGEVRDLAPRLMLHAARLAFAHPVSGLRIAVEAPVPPDFEFVRQRLANA
jgi:RluA family pseudouridine synthase